ncbi:magnesium ion transporter, partial [Linderina macrospora]
MARQPVASPTQQNQRQQRQQRQQRYMSFNMFDLLPDLERLKTKRSRKLEAAVGKGKVRPDFLSGFEHLTKPLGDNRPPKPKPKPEPFVAKEPTSRMDQNQQTPELTLRCTELDKDGNVTVRAGEFQKSELCAQHGLQPRDLRKIDSKFVNQMPAILVRRHAILVNLLHIRALIEADRVVLFDSIGSASNYNQSMLVYELQERLRSSQGALAADGESQQPFEFRALEAMLISVVNSLQSDEEVLVNLVQNLLAYLEES